MLWLLVLRSLANNRHKEILMDLDVWNVSGYPPAVSSSVIACCRGAGCFDGLVEGTTQLARA